MMRQPFSCPHCGTHYQIPSNFEGREVSCAKCGKGFTIHFTNSGESLPTPQPEALYISINDSLLLTGKLALKLHYLTREQLKQALQKQQESKRSGEEILFGELLVQEGYLTQTQLNYIISVQQLNKTRADDRIFGEILIENEFATQIQVDNGFETQKRIFNEEKVTKPICDILMEDEVINQEQCEQSKAAQKRLMASSGTSEAPKQERPAEDPAPPVETGAVAEQPVAEEAAPPFSINVTPDGLRATLRLGSREEPPTLEAVLEELSSRGISYNRLPDEEIAQFLLGSPGPEAELEVATGIAPGKSTDARIECKFDEDPMKIGRMKEDGVIDFKDRGEIPQVRKGDVVAIKIPRERGSDGTDIYGKKIESRKPEDIKLRTGKGAGLTQDRMSAVANYDGKPIKTPSGIIDVLHSLQIKGDVGIETGHIKFDGDVQVAGMVEKGFEVKAGSMTVNELDGAIVDIRGDLNVKGGIIDSKVRVGGNLKAKYIRTSKVNVVGDAIIASEIMETEMEIGGSLLSEKCKIYETVIGAGGNLTVLDVGSEASNPDTITLSSSAAYDAEKLELVNAIKLQQQAIADINDKIGALKQENDRLNEQVGVTAQRQDKAMVRKRDNPDDPEAIAEFEASEEAMNELFAAQDTIIEKSDALQVEIETHNREIEHLEEEQAALETLMQKEKASTQYLHVKGMLFEGTLIKAKRTKLTIDKAIHKVSIFEESYNDKNGIETWRMKVDGLKI